MVPYRTKPTSSTMTSKAIAIRLTRERMSSDAFTPNVIQEKKESKDS